MDYKVDIHKNWIEKYLEVISIDKVTLEIGTFDTQRLKAMKNGEKLPEAAFMNSVRYILVDEIYALQEKLDISFEIEITYGSMTKLKRKELGVEK